MLGDVPLPPDLCLIHPTPTPFLPGVHHGKLVPHMAREASARFQCSHFDASANSTSTASNPASRRARQPEALRRAGTRLRRSANELRDAVTSLREPVTRVRRAATPIHARVEPFSRAAKGITALRTRFTGRRSRVTARRTRVTGPRSRVTARRTRVTGPRSRVPARFGTRVTSSSTGPRSRVPALRARVTSALEVGFLRFELGSLAPRGRVPALRTRVTVRRSRASARRDELPARRIPLTRRRPRDSAPRKRGRWGRNPGRRARAADRWRRGPCCREATASTHPTGKTSTPEMSRGGEEPRKRGRVRGKAATGATYQPGMWLRALSWMAALAITSASSRDAGRGAPWRAGSCATREDQGRVVRGARVATSHVVPAYHDSGSSRGAAFAVVTEGGERAVGLASRAVDAAERAMLRESTPRIEREILPERSPFFCIEVLREDFQRCHLAKWPVPGDAGVLDGHVPGVASQLDQEIEARRPLVEPSLHRLA